jgi:hypothetical protein
MAARKTPLDLRPLTHPALLAEAVFASQPEKDDQARKQGTWEQRQYVLPPVENS